MKIGKKLKSFRKNASLTQQALADKCHVSRGYIADLEADRYNPSMDTLSTIANALSIPIRDFIETKDITPQENSTELIEFKTPQEAIKFILSQPAIMGFGGFDVNKMSDEDILDFANELLNQLKLLGYKYKK
jgi:transcriptional regulator with XRE-family HTH domain